MQSSIEAVRGREDVPLGHQGAPAVVGPALVTKVLPDAVGDHPRPGGGVVRVVPDAAGGGLGAPAHSLYVPRLVQHLLRGGTLATVPGGVAIHYTKTFLRTPEVLNLFCAPRPRRASRYATHSATQYFAIK